MQTAAFRVSETAVCIHAAFGDLATRANGHAGWRAKTLSTSRCSPLSRRVSAIPANPPQAVPNELAQHRQVWTPTPEGVPRLSPGDVAERLTTALASPARAAGASRAPARHCRCHRVERVFDEAGRG